jgi:hypothetical protein
MLSFRSVAATGLMLAALVMPAQAVTIDANSATLLITDDAGLQGVSVTGPFNVFYNFSLNSAFNVSVIGDNASGDINPLTVQLFNGTNGGALITSNLGTLAVALAPQLIGPGNFSIEISGTAPGTSSIGGSVGLVAPSQIPLPGALVLFGSGMIGLIVLGRKRKVQPAEPVLA